MRKKVFRSRSSSPTAGSASALPVTTSASTPTAAPPEDVNRGGLLVLVELGGDWPTERAAKASARRVVAQLEGETPGAFAERVVSGLDGLFGRGIRLETLVLACNERLDDVADNARRKTLSLALGRMAKHQAGRAYLTASARSGGRLRHALSVLAQGCGDEWRTAGLEVSVDFGEESRPSAQVTSLPLTARVA